METRETVARLSGRGCICACIYHSVLVCIIGIKQVWFVDLESLTKLGFLFVCGSCFGVRPRKLEEILIERERERERERWQEIDD